MAIALVVTDDNVSAIVDTGVTDTKGYSDNSTINSHSFITGYEGSITIRILSEFIHSSLEGEPSK